MRGRKSGVTSISQFRTQARALAETAVFGAAGGTLLLLAHVPAGGLVGAMVAVAAASLSGRPTGAPVQIQTALFLFMGVAVGATVTPDALRSALVWPLSLAILVAATFVITVIGDWIFQKLGRCDPVTAFYASAPGAFSMVIVMAQADGADMAQVASAQVLRLAALTAASPLLLATAPLHPLQAHLAAGMQGAPAWALLGAAVAVGWALAEKLKWPSASFLGPMAASALVHGAGLISVSFPRPVVMVASAALGAIVGTRFSGVKPMELLRFLPTVLVALLVMTVIAMGAGWGAGLLSGVGPTAGVLGFAPGSMDVMIAISLAVGASPAYVTAHQTARLLVLLAVLPVLARRRMTAVGRPAAAEL